MTKLSYVTTKIMVAYSSYKTVGDKQKQMMMLKLSLFLVLTAVVSLVMGTFRFYFILENQKPYDALLRQDGIESIRIDSASTDSDFIDSSMDDGIGDYDEITASAHQEAFEELQPPQQKESQQQQQQQQPQGIVILAGPHKTSTTSIQTCMVQWASWNPYKVEPQSEKEERRVRRPQQRLLEPWVWAIPTRIDMLQAGLLPLMEQKRFAPLLSVLRGSYRFQRNVTTTKKEKVLNVYRERMQQVWDDGDSIIYGAEAMDYVIWNNTRNPPTLGQSIMDGILDVLPSSSDESRKPQPQVVINYRTPRVKHLISIWHEQGPQNVSLSTFILRDDFLFQADSLALALAFMERELPITIVDMSGVNHAGVGMCELVACDILKVPCTSDYNITALEGQRVYPKRLNEKHGRGEMDLTQQQLNIIDRIMNEYDCGLMPFVLANKPRILMPRDIFSSCRNGKPDANGKNVQPRKSFEWMLSAIKDVVRLN